MGVGPIPWTALHEYARAQGIGDPDDFEVFRSIIGALDALFLDHVAEKQKKPEAPKAIDKPARRR